MTAHQKIEALEQAANTIHRYLVPHWEGFHEADTEKMPDILSTHTCRESSAFGLIVLERLGLSGWRIEHGEVLFDSADDVPIDITDFEGYGVPDPDMTSAPHTWLKNDELDLIIDLTADQFGSLLLPTSEGPLVAHQNDVFDTYEIAFDPHDWSGNHEIVERAEIWADDTKFEPLLRQAAADLGLSDVSFRDAPTSFAPRPLRNLLREVRDHGLAYWEPETIPEAIEKIRILERIGAALILNPDPGAHERALSVLEETTDVMEEKWQPATDLSKTLKREIVKHYRGVLSEDRPAPRL